PPLSYSSSPHLRNLPSSPTRRSSDLYHMARDRDFQLTTSFGSFLALVCKRKWLNVPKKNQRMQVTKSTDDLLHIEDPSETQWEEDRKSTRLNSSHVKISYAVFCLKKK